MNSKQYTKVYREKVKKRKLIDKLSKYENLSSEEEIPNNHVLHTHVCSNIHDFANSGMSDEESVCSEICSDQELEENIESLRSGSSSDKENNAESTTKIKELPQWAIECNTSHSDLDKLLKILKRRLDKPSNMLKNSSTV